MWRLSPLLLVLACAPVETDLLVGEWEVEMTCDEDFEDIPACTDGGPIFLVFDGSAPPTGTFRSFFPGFTGDGGSLTGIPGLVTGGWDRGELQLALIGDVEDPFASPGDVEAWTEYHLELYGRPSGGCWTATWWWVDSNNGIYRRGEADLVRRGRDCP